MSNEDLQFVVYFALLAILLAAERFLPKRPIPASWRRWLANAGLTLINILALGLLPVTFFGAAFWARSEHLGLFNRVEMPLVAFIAANLLARGLISFVTHYLMHRIPLFWAVHRVHHLDTELDVSTTVRFHPLEFFIGLLPGVPMVVAFGLDPAVLGVYELLDVAVTLFSHANIRMAAPLDRLLRYVLVTPELHRVHHSTWQPETDSNFSAVFPIWDLVFGTFRTETREPQESMELGLGEVRDGRTSSVGWLLVSPFVRFEAGTEGRDESRRAPETPPLPGVWESRSASGPDHET
jgi:sterol desaturase/sphingolipid hydroxylase (fatty acid hydroxylase superfamily)